MNPEPPARPTLELACKPDFVSAMERVEAWWQQEMLDRPPIRFTAHNSDYTSVPNGGRNWPSLKARWFDAEYQVDSFVEGIHDRVFHAETFPIFWPNLGPEVYAAFYGSELTFQEVTSYSVPLVREWEDVKSLRLDLRNEYFRKLEEMTRLALEKCAGRFMVGYTDLHPGADCAAAWRDPQEFCLDLIGEPDRARELIRLASADSQRIYDHFDATLKAHGQLSVAWMGIPSYGKMHIPSCDVSALISPKHFDEFCLPVLAEEVRPMTHNVFHVDGRGVARHLPRILEIPEINAIQWVQGMGRDTPILQWLPLIKRIQTAGKSVVVDLQLAELEDFIANMSPKGLFLCIAAEEQLQPEIIRRLERW